MSIPAEDLHHWTRERYDQLAEVGVFGPGDRVELIDGLIYEMTPQKSLHATAIYLAQTALSSVLPRDHMVRVQLPLALADDSEPEPDIAVVVGDPRSFRQSHPTKAALIVEIADSSAYHDRERKKPLYARCGIPEYWILDLSNNTLEIHREPGSGTYRFRGTLKASDTVSPLCAPQAVLTVRDLLP